jgi:hypothetical protein
MPQLRSADRAQRQAVLGPKFLAQEIVPFRSFPGERNALNCGEIEND